MGIRLPVRDIVREIRRRAELRFVVVDGAQTLGHVPLQLAENDYDFFIAGCHKWLGAHHPLGLGFFGNPATADFIRQSAEHLVAHRMIDDPLLRFGYELEGLHGSRYGETVNVSPLLTPQGAVEDCDPGCLRTTLHRRIANADRLAARIEEAGWKPLVAHAPHRTGILVLQSRRPWRTLSPERIRLILNEQGVAGSTYPKGFVRLSMPDAYLTDPEIDWLIEALREPHRQLAFVN